MQRWLGRVGWGAALVLGVVRLAAGCTSTTRSSSASSTIGINDPDSSSSTTSTQVVGSVELDIMTGADSLRLDSSATATIQYTGGESEVIVLPLHNSNEDGGLDINFTEDSTSTVTADIHYSQTIESVVIALVSHPIPDVESNDSWTIDGVRMSVTYSGAASTCVLDQAGATVTDNQPLVLTPGGCAADGTLELLVVTGGDDLRSDSTATVTVNYQGGASDVVPLTQSFSANTTVQENVGLVSSQPITSLVFAMQSHPSVTESADSWTITQVEALTSSGDGGAPMCIINALGKSITDGVTLTLTPGGCPTEADDGGADASSDASSDAETD